MSEPIKRYDVTGHDGCMRMHPSGDFVDYDDHLAALESARAEAFRMGQEEMRERAGDALRDAIVAAIDDGRHTPERAISYIQFTRTLESIRSLPLKDKP